MKLHPDGTVEGTPEEIMKYQLLKPIGVKPLDAMTSIRTPLSGAATCTSQVRYDANTQNTSVQVSEIAGGIS